MAIQIDLNSLANIVSLFGIAFLFVFWLFVSRKLIGFLLVLAGAVTIVVMVRGPHTPTVLLGELVAAAVFTALLLTLYSLIGARALRRRYPMYRPSGNASAATTASRQAQTEREASEISADKQIRRRSAPRSRQRGGSGQRYVVNAGPRKQGSKAAAARLK